MARPGSRSHIAYALTPIVLRRLDAMVALLEVEDDQIDLWALDTLRTLVRKYRGAATLTIHGSSFTNVELTTILEQEKARA